LAARAEAVQRRADAAETEVLRYGDGTVAVRREGEHIKSIQSYAEDAWRRLYKRAVPEGDPLDDEAFHRFYRRVQKALQRSDAVENRGDAVPTGDRKHRHTHGRRFAPSEVVRDAARGRPTAPPPEATPCTAPGDFRPYGESEDAVREMERHIAETNELHRAFTHGVTAGKLNGGRRTADGRRFETRHARECDDRPHYISVGRWREDEVERVTRLSGADRAVPLRVPWIVAEIDGRVGRDKDRSRSDQLARRLLRRLETFGVDLADVVVSYSGNASVHIRIPDGVVGCPVYRSEKAASSALRRFFDRLCGDDTELRRAIDNAVLRPSQLIRAVGSIHEATDRRTVATDGRTFLEKPAYFLWHLSEPQFQYTAHRLPLPRRASFNGPLSALLYPPKPPRSDTPSKTSVSQSLSPSTGPVARVQHGVEEGEPWGADVDGYDHAVGRNWAALIWSHYALEQAESHPTAWEAVRRWNKMNGPPLPESELRDVFERAKRYRVRQSRSWNPTSPRQYTSK
jgi:hypothetical protein